MLFPAVRSLGQEEFPLPCRSCPRALAGYWFSRDWERQHRPRCWSWAIEPFPEPFCPSWAFRLQPRKGPSPMSFLSWVVSSVLAGAASCPHTHANTPEITADPKNQGAKHPRGAICSQNPCCVTVRASAPWAIFAFRHDLHDYCFWWSNFIIAFTLRFSFLCSQTTTLH